MRAIQPIDEQLLVTRLKTGDKDAFARIYEKYHRQLHVIALRYLKDESLAQDIVHEIFIKLWSYRENLKEELSLKAFLSKSVQNLVLNTIRNKKTEILKHLELSHKLDNNHRSDSEEDYVLSEYTRIAEKGIRELSPAKRTIFRMRSYHCLSNQEVALKLGISINTVKFQFSQASKFLRAYLKNKADINGY
ncbi:MAG: RNA polymerase sigma-70 factor [Chitinophagaceae bacterium]|nr:RNA polymerase sigma-70 factor [Chitinophagaceae bacterium]